MSFSVFQMDEEKFEFVARLQVLMRKYTTRTYSFDPELLALFELAHGFKQYN